jgi:hypothetical protein
METDHIVDQVNEYHMVQEDDSEIGDYEMTSSEFYTLRTSAKH